MRALLVMLLALALGGCGCSDDPGVDPLTDRELEAIPALSPTQLQDLLDAQKGKLVVLAVWSVRREASVAAYRRLGELRGEPEPVVLAIDIDRVSDVREKVLPILRETKPQFENRVLSVGPEALATFIDRNTWAGQLPAFALYGRDGKKLAAFHGPDALDRARAELGKLLKARRR